jgi:hypothetical protein
MSDAKTNLTLVAGYDGSDGSRRALAVGVQVVSWW